MNLGAVAGALATMMRSRAIVDFELFESIGEFFVRVWPPEECDRSDLRKHVAALLLESHVDELHVMVVDHLGVAMVPPFNSKNEPFHHNSSNCRLGNRVWPQHRVEGTANKPLCKNCRKLNGDGRGRP